MRVYISRLRELGRKSAGPAPAPRPAADKLMCWARHPAGRHISPAVPPPDATHAAKRSSQPRASPRASRGGGGGGRGPAPSRERTRKAALDTA